MGMICAIIVVTRRICLLTLCYANSVSHQRRINMATINITLDVELAEEHLFMLKRRAVFERRPLNDIIVEVLEIKVREPK